jgi:hypothetical protein
MVQTRRSCVLWAGFLLCLAPSWATAEVSEGESELDRGRELYLEAAFERARLVFEETLGSADLDPGDALEAHRYLAALELIVGEADAAERHAAAAVALDPSVEAPEGAPPELGELLDSVRADQGERRAELRIATDEEELEQGQASTIAAELRPAPEALVATLRLRCDDSEAEATPPTVEVSVTPDPEAEQVHCDASAETEAGAVLLQAARDFAVRREEAGVGGGGDDDGGVLWWPWVLGAGVAAVVAGLVAVIVLNTGPEDAYIAGPRVDGW